MNVKLVKLNLFLLRPDCDHPQCTACKVCYLGLFLKERRKREQEEQERAEAEERARREEEREREEAARREEEDRQREEDRKRQEEEVRPWLIPAKVSRNLQYDTNLTPRCLPRKYDWNSQHLKPKNPSNQSYLFQHS